MTRTANWGQPPHSRLNPAHIQADPKLYLQQLPTIRRQTQYASAALLGAASSLPLLTVRSDNPFLTVASQENIIAEIARTCPLVLKDDASLFGKLLQSADTATLHLLCLGTAPLISAVSWNTELAQLAVDKAPLCYLFLPPDLLMECSDHDKHLLESGFHKLLVEGDPTTIDNCLFNPRSPLIFVGTGNWRFKLYETGPQLYLCLPESLITNDTTLALAALTSPKAKNSFFDYETYGYHVCDEVDDILSRVDEFCRGIFSDPTVLKEIFDPQGATTDDVIHTVLWCCSDRIVWDQELVDIACKRSPASYSFLPARFREDNIDAQRVMASLLLEPSSSDVAVAVDDVISAVPGFFADRDAVEQLFRGAQSDDVVKHVVTSLCTTLLWDKRLMRLASDRYEHMVGIEINRIFKENVTDDCKCHIPLGMLVTDMVARDVDVWPDFLNKCGCHFVRNDSFQKEAFEFAHEILRSLSLRSDMTTWLEALVFRLKLEYFESKETFQTFLKCVHVAGNGTPLEFLKGDEETSIAFKRHIAEYLGALGNPKRAETKQDALKLVYCLLSIPRCKS